MPRTKKAPKDTNAPKKPQTAYFLFSNKRRPVLQEANKDKRITEIAKLVGAEWKLLGEEEKKSYSAQAAKLREEYNVAFKAYQQTENYKLYQQKLAEWKLNNEAVASKGGKSSKGVVIKLPKKPKDKNAPKRNMSAYFHFSNKRRPLLREANKEKKITEIAKMIGEEWKTLSDEDKKPFQEQAAAEKISYEEAWAKYKETDNYANQLVALSNWKKKCEELKQRKKELDKEAKAKQERSSRKHKSRRYSSSSESDSDSSSSDSDSSSGSSSYTSSSSSD